MYFCIWLDLLQLFQAVFFKLIFFQFFKVQNQSLKNKSENLSKLDNNAIRTSFFRRKLLDIRLCNFIACKSTLWKYDLFIKEDWKGFQSSTNLTDSCLFRLMTKYLWLPDDFIMASLQLSLSLSLRALNDYRNTRLQE